VTDLHTLGEVLTGARCWGIELDPRYRVLAVTVEPDPLRAPGTPGELQLLCFPVSVLLVAVTHPIEQGGAQRTALVTFDLEQLTAVSERFAGASMEGSPFGQPEPRPGIWGPRYSLEGRTSAADGTRSTLTLDLATSDGDRLRMFARFDDAELRDARRDVVMGTSAPSADLHGLLAQRSDERQGSATTAPDGADASSPDSDEGSDTLRF